MKRNRLDDSSFVFTTYDLGLGAALLCRGFKLLLIDKSKPRTPLLSFKRERDIENVANSYVMGRLEVKAKSFFDHLETIKIKLRLI